MPQRKTLASLATILALVMVPALAEEQHNPAVARPGAAASAPSMHGGMMPRTDGSMPMMGMMRMMMGQDGMGGMRMMAEHVEGRLAFLKVELKITDAQLPLWDAFAKAMRDSATEMQGMQSGMIGMNQATALPDKLAAREKMLTARLDAARKLKAVAQPLYAALSAEQKKTADEIMISPMGMVM